MFARRRRIRVPRITRKAPYVIVALAATFGLAACAVEAPQEPTPVVQEQAGDSAEVPAPAEAPEVQEEPTETVGQQQALASATTYLDVMAFSKSGLVTQLEFDEFSEADAKYAADHVKVDWDAQAAKAAKNYLDVMAFSGPGLQEQLEYDGFTPEQAEFGVKSVGY